MALRPAPTGIVLAVRLRHAALGAVLVIAGSACSGGRGTGEAPAIAPVDPTTSSTAGPVTSSPTTATTLETPTTTATIAARPAAPATQARPGSPTTRSAASLPARTATSATTQAAAPSTTATSTSASGPTTATSTRPAGPNDVPRAWVTDVNSGQDVNLRTLIPAERPILFWFYSPH